MANIKTNNSTESELNKLRRQLEVEQKEHKKTAIKLKAKERELHAITKSSSYKLARALATSKHATKKGINLAKELNPKRIHMLARNRRHVKAVYSSNEFKNAFSDTPSADTAVIIHLFYVDMLPLFEQLLRRLADAGINYDIYITVPDTRAHMISAIKEQIPQARVAIVPNCGRDVLPFTQVVKYIKGQRYDKILKLHSKKSPHRDDGNEWRDKILDSLVPANKGVIKDVIKQLEQRDSAIIGPAGEYVSLIVNLSATAHHLKNLTSKILSKKAADNLITVADEYGFFAGTMFWARLDALMPVLEQTSIEDFEPELGQQDTTLAHALERLLNVIPELQGRHMFEVNANGVKQIDPHTINIPAWSELADEDKD